MIVVADSSPLIVLAKLSCFHLLEKLYSYLHISLEVHHEVVVAGAGLPGASEVEQASWIEVKTLSNPTALAQNRQKFSLGLGELSSILLAQELGADIILLDDFNARRLARSVGLEVRGGVGLLEIAYKRGYVADLRAVFQQLLENSAYVDRRLLNQRLGFLGLRPL